MSRLSEKAQWYWQRLQAMSAPEVGYRLQQRWLTERERLAVSKGALRTDVGASYWRDKPLRPWLQVTEVDVFYGRFPQAAATLIAEADKIVAGEVTLFGYEVVQLGQRPNWHQDPITQHLWPADKFYADIATRWGGGKTIWEAARHHFLVTLAQAYWLTREVRYLAAITAYLESWFEQNRPYHGVHWCSGLEMGIRLVSWAWLFDLLPMAKLPNALRDAWGETIVAYGTHLSHHLSRYSSANNHLIGEACGLALAGLLAARAPQASQWLIKGLTVLEAEAVKQILPDGVPAEQTTHYLGFILDFYLFLGAIPTVKLAQQTLARLAAAGWFMRAIMDEAGRLPAIGDEDGGHVFTLLPNAATTPTVRLTTLAVLCDQPALALPTAAYDAWSWWLLGEAGAEKLAAASTPVILPQAEFPQGGYWVLRGGEGDSARCLTFDCGPLGYLSLAAHGHADCLAVWLSVGKRPFLVDAGTYNYHEKPEWRAFFQGTAAHNTVRVDGLNQSEATGPTVWGRRAQPTLIGSGRSEWLQWVMGQHDGYTHLAMPLVHQRAVLFVRGDYYLLVDWLLGEGEHTVEQFFHLPPMATWQEADGGYVVAVAEQVLQMVFVASVHTTTTMIKGEHDPIQGWHSARFGQKEPSPTVMNAWQGVCPQWMVTLLWLGGEKRPLLNVTGTVEQLEISLTTGSHREIFVATPQRIREQREQR